MNLQVCLLHPVFWASLCSRWAAMCSKLAASCIHLAAYLAAYSAALCTRLAATCSPQYVPGSFIGDCLQSFLDCENCDDAVDSDELPEGEEGGDFSSAPAAHPLGPPAATPKLGFAAPRRPVAQPAARPPLRTLEVAQLAVMPDEHLMEQYTSLVTALGFVRFELEKQRQLPIPPTHGHLVVLTRDAYDQLSRASKKERERDKADSGRGLKKPKHPADPKEEEKRNAAEEKKATEEKKAAEEEKAAEEKKSEEEKKAEEDKKAEEKQDEGSKEAPAESASPGTPKWSSPTPAQFPAPAVWLLTLA